MTGKRTQILVRLDPSLVERVDAVRPGSRNDWLIAAIEAYLPASTTAPGEVELSVSSGSRSTVAAPSRSWR